MELAYRLWKAQRAEKAKTLFLHGMGGTGSLWRPIAAGLEDDYSVLAPDQRGHGGSQIPTVPGGRQAEGYTPLDYGRDLVETLNSLNYHPTWVIGHSMGVRSACALAHLKPEWVRGLVLVDLGFSGVAGGGLGEGLAEFLRQLPARFASRAEAKEFMARECPDPSIGQYLMAVSQPTAEGGITFPFDHAALIQTIQAARDASVRTWISEFAARKLPVLVLRGARSLVWSAPEYEAEHERFKGAPSIRFEEFPEAGHGLPFEKRVEFTARLRRFFESGGSQ